MEKQEVVKMVLELSGCQSSKSISAMAMRKFGFEISPAQVSGVLRAMISRGEAASSSDGAGQKLYWLTRREFDRKEN